MQTPQGKVERNKYVLFIEKAINRRYVGSFSYLKSCLQEEKESRIWNNGFKLKQNKYTNFQEKLWNQWLQPHDRPAA